MSGRWFTPLLLLALTLGLVAADLSPLPWAGTAAPATAESVFGYGAVVGLQGTPHLWIADEAGVLHWGGDTRALRNRFVDWSARVDVSLDALKTLTRGDPYLTAGLLKDGEPIHLVKWETEEALPRLFHIQCIPDVELFGIKTENYLNFVIDRPDWESRTWEGMRLQANTLQKLELPGAAVCGNATATPSALTPTITPTPTKPRLTISTNEIASCPWQRYGLSAADANVAKTLTVALPPSVSQMAGSSSPPVLEQLAPLVRPPTGTQGELQNTASAVAVGVAKFGRQVTVGSGNLVAGSYIVVVRGGPPPQVAFASCSAGTEIATTSVPTFRTLVSRNVSPPQAIITSNSGICYSWNRVQVCLPPTPAQLMTGAETSAMNAIMNDTVSHLASRGRLNAADINTGIILPDLEGAEGVRTARGTMLASPAGSWPGASANDAVAGALKVDVDVAGIPGYPTVPAGEYAVRVSGSISTGWRANLIETNGRQIGITLPSQEVLGSVTSPEVAIVNLAFVLSPDVQLCFFGECGP